ncbi:MAG: ADP-ribosylation factor-directed GTPase activating protein isoform b [Pirellulales bacterium]|nr:ADP-ribosylation factor-directed GTPase activating protein isoform b [Pirellulales bacterium]
MFSARTLLPPLVVLAALGLSGCSQEVALDEMPTAPLAVQESDLPSDEEIRTHIDQVLAYTGARHLNAQEHAAWQVVHGIVGFGRGLQMYNQGELVSALDYLLAGGTLRGWNLFPGDHGLETLLEQGSKSGQGHPDQWLGYLSLCGLEADQTIVVQGKTFTVNDLVTQAQWDIYDGMEASWTLMGLSTYLPLDAKWTARDGSEWTLDRICEMEAAQNLGESACGGSHRMCALTVAVNRYLAEGGELNGGWLSADQKIRQTVDICRRFQQADGCFSTSYFERPGNSPDLSLRMSTTGHTLEFLTYALNDEELKEPWVTAAVVRLCKIFDQTRDLPMECGGLYHSARALQNYRLRRFGAPAFVGEEVADGSATSVDQGGEAAAAIEPAGAVPVAR